MFKSVIKVEHGSDGFPSWPGEMLGKIKIKYFSAGGCHEIHQEWKRPESFCIDYASAVLSPFSFFFVKLSRFNLNLITFKIENIIID